MQNYSFTTLLLIALLFCSTFLSAQDRSRRGRTSTNQCTHNGKVVLHDYRYGGISNAEVIYRSINGRITKSVKTQADGSYQITLPQGDYNVTAKHANYYTPDRYGFPACMNDGESGYIVMEAQPKQNACEHRGRVVLYDYNTGGIANATVFYKTPNGNIKIKTTTSSEGHYAVYLPRQTFLATAKHPQYHTPAQYKFDITCEGEGGYIVMEPNPVEGVFTPMNPEANTGDIHIVEPHPQLGGGGINSEENIPHIKDLNFQPTGPSFPKDRPVFPPNGSNPSSGGPNIPPDGSNFLPNDNANFAISMPEIEEDCIHFDPHNLQVEQDDHRFLLLDQAMSLIAFDNHEEAEMSKEVMLRYQLNQQCFVGRPNASFKYFLTDGQAPTGEMGNEDCLDFNPNNISVQQIQGRWKIVEGNNWMFDFENNEQEARQAFAVIQKYGFTKTCFVGRPNPEMQYLRR